MDSKEEIISGVYEHYKGNLYLVIGIARHSETGEVLVVYIPLYPAPGYQISVRPIQMWNEMIQITPNTLMPRFRKRVEY